MGTNIKTLVSRCELVNVLQEDNFNEDKDIKGCYICDLLSLVMSNAQKDDVWITVQGNINTIAVATLTEVACIIVSNGISLDENARQKAIEEKVPIFSSTKTSYELAKIIAELV